LALAKLLELVGYLAKAQLIIIIYPRHEWRGN